jgi:hypothetical protein
LRWWAAAFVAFVACGAPSREDWPAGHPRIDDAAFLEQTPGKPFHLEFSIAFEDTDGDLSGGAMTLYVNDFQRSSVSVADAFGAQRPPLPLDATEGRLRFAIQIEPIEAGQEVELGFMLVDAKGNESNMPRLKLQALGGS